MLEDAIKAAGYATVRIEPAKLIQGALPEVHVWVLDCDDDSKVEDAIEWLEPEILALSNRPAPADEPNYRPWCDKIMRTLDKWTANVRHPASDKTASSSHGYAGVEAVWILAASNGGIGAVSEFLWALSPVPPVAFVYAQHIEPAQQSMVEAVGRANRKLSCTLAMGRHWLNPGQVLIAPAACKIQFSKQGEVFSLRDPWRAPKKPHIDQLMMDMSGLMPPPAGAIVFSGSGKDGLEGLRALKAVGTRVWAQDPQTADDPSMPHHAITLGLTSQTGSPQDLAEKLLKLYPPGSSD